MTSLESNLYWRKRRQTILQSLNAQPTGDLACTCMQALSTSNSSNCSSCTFLTEGPDNADGHPCTCRHLSTPPSKCRLCQISSSRTKLTHSPVKMTGQSTFETISSQFPCRHQGLVSNNKNIFKINRLDLLRRRIYGALNNALVGSV